MVKTTVDTIRLDDLEEGRWYRFTTRRDHETLETEGQFLGYDGCYAFLREEGSLRAEPWPTTFLARCRIEAIYAPAEIIDPEYEPLAEARERLDAEDSPHPFTARERRAMAIAAVGVAMFWVVFFLWVVWR